MGQLDAFRRSGRARRVNQRRHVAAVDRTPRRLEVEVGRRALLQRREGCRFRRRPVDADDVFDLGAAANRLDPLNEVMLAEHDSIGGVAEQILDLLGRRRVVDRERRGAEVQGGAVNQMELGSVGHHHRDRIAAPDPERCQGTGDALDALAILPPGDLDCAPGCAQCDAFAKAVRGTLKRLTEAGCVEMPVGLIAHRSPSLIWTELAYRSESTDTSCTCGSASNFDPFQRPIGTPANRVKVLCTDRVGRSWVGSILDADRWSDPMPIHTGSRRAQSPGAWERNDRARGGARPTRRAGGMTREA